jgi:hypothetical protein
MDETDIKLEIKGPLPLKELASLLSRLSEQYQKQQLTGAYPYGTQLQKWLVPMVKPTQAGFIVYMKESY